MPATGYRNNTTGALTNVGGHIDYWSSSTHASGSNNATFLRYWQGELGPLYGTNRANAFSVRCVQHLQARLSLRLFDTLVSILFSEIR